MKKVFRAQKSKNQVLFREKNPKTFGIKKAPVQLWIEMVYFIIILGKSNKLLNHTPASPQLSNWENVADYVT